MPAPVPLTPSVLVLVTNLSTNLKIMARRKNPATTKAFLWITQEWLVLLITILLLLAIAISAAGAREYIQPLVKDSYEQPMRAGLGDEEIR